MRRRLGGVVVAVLCGTVAHAGCRAIEDLGAYDFDSADAGAPDADAVDAAGPDTDADAPDACAPAGYACGAAPPAGWAGPVALYEGAPGQVPPCPSDYPMMVAQGTSGVSAPPVTCGACTCGTPAATCAFGPLESYSQNMCNGQSAALKLTSGTCASLPQSSDSFSQVAPQASVGPCAPAGGGVAATPPPQWTTAGVACGMSGQPSTCAGGSVCAPTPAAPFDGQWCVWKTGAASCPPGFPGQHVWETASDTRGCTSCVCGDPTATTCTMTTEFFSDSACQKSLSSLNHSSACYVQLGTQSVQATASFGQPSSCQAGGGMATGAVVGTPAVTLCCLQ